MPGIQKIGDWYFISLTYVKLNNNFVFKIPKELSEEIAEEFGKQTLPIGIRYTKTGSQRKIEIIIKPTVEVK